MLIELKVLLDRLRAVARAIHNLRKGLIKYLLNKLGKMEGVRAAAMQSFAPPSHPLPLDD
jgi:hypothetical protein